ncbi:MAG: methionyl-tRNA formyltransferase, partial [Coprococcus sp.]
MNIVYMGTPEFAVKALSAIVDAGHNVMACFTQPDKPKGRGKNMVPTPVKEKAISYNIPVYQPEKLRNEENVSIIRQLSPDAIVVAAYGQLLPESILNIPKFGCINIHASLLPKYRGAAPIEWSIINGEKETGVTTMYMAKGLDTGDMIEKMAVAIDDKDTGLTLHDKLAEAGAKLIVSTLAALEAGTAVRTPQDDSESCYASMLTKDMGRMDFSKDAAELERLIRGLQPWPCAYTTINNKNVKV